jgi:hypothetical protein
MKKLTILMVIAALTLTVNAQSPQKMSYQAVVRNSSGALVANQAVGMKISILQGSATGTVVFSETYSPNPQTNANGLVTVEIGSGITVIGTFSGINWASGPFFLKTETDPGGGTNYTITGTSQLLSVPYALYAKTAANGFSGAWADITGKPAFATVATSGSYNDLLNKPSLFSGSYNDLTNKPALFDGTWASLTGKPTFATVATSGSYNDLLNKPNLFDGTWNSLTGKPAGFADGIDNVDDADNSITNEIQALSLSGTTLSLSIGGGSVTLPSSGGGDNWGTQTVVTNNTLTGTGTTASPLGVANAVIAPAWANITGKPTTLAGYGITNGMSTSHPANAIISTNITNWNTAYGWGNHAGLYRPVSWAPTWSDITGKPTFATVATSGSYNDLTNKPTFINSQWTTNSSNIYYNTGRVGIGTSTPGGFLNIQGNSDILLPHLMLTESEDDYARLLFNNTTATTKNWAIAGRSDAADADSRLNFWYWNGSSGENIMSIGGSGTVTVDIGTSSPQTFLQVHSNATYTYGITPLIRISDNFKEWNIGLGNDGDRFSIASEDLTERFTILKSNGSVGIGPIAPAYKLDVAGNLNIINGRYGDALWCNGSQALWWDGTYFSWGYGGTYNYFADPITIGNVTNPTGYALWVQGNAFATGSWTSSDARYKKNISTIENSLDKVMKIRGTSFEFRSDEFKDYQFAEGPQFGLIAQEVENIFPEVVKTESNGYKSVNYDGMIPILIESIKEQQQHIESQQKQIDELTHLVKNLMQK